MQGLRTMCTSTEEASRMTWKVGKGDGDGGRGDLSIPFPCVSIVPVVTVSGRNIRYGLWG